MRISRSTRKKEMVRLGRECRGCGHCCRFGAGYVLLDEPKMIAKKLSMGEEEFIREHLDLVERFHTPVYKIKTARKGTGHGQCVFYSDKKGCTIQSAKPLHCKVSTCSRHGEAIQEWFALNYFVNRFDPQSLREWNTHVKLSGTIPGGRVAELLPDRQKVDKILRYKILR
jgi:Fe-S-cluster containining protein